MHGRARFLQRVAGRLPPALGLLMAYLIIGAILRIALWVSFAQVDVGAKELWWILPNGTTFDLVWGFYGLMPFMAYLVLLPERWSISRWNVMITTTGSIATLTAFLYLACVEYFFFEEFSARFNLVAVDYLMYPTEVFGDIREAYPVGAVLAVSATVAVFSRWLLRRALSPIARPRVPSGAWVATAAFLFLALGVRFAEARSPVPDALVNRVARELADNGVRTFFQALATSEIEYPVYYQVRDRTANTERLRQYFTSQGTAVTESSDGDLQRYFPPNPLGLGRLNVVVVAEESLGAEFSRLYGSVEDLTPNFDHLATQSLWFRNMYASGTRTVRGLEAITASFPPIPSVSILRRPGNEDIATWGSVLRKQGYRTSFLYGGYGYFDNMNYFFGHNGFQVIDRSDIQHARFANIWGVSDEDLFDLALEHFDVQYAAGGPFFSIIMTTSNHKPFTFREGVPGVPASGGGRPAGVRYSDFALGYFFDEARRHEWFRNTVFVVLGDHGARVYGKEEIPLRTYEIPMLIHAPDHLSPGEITTLTSQIDVAPTVLGLLGFGYQAPFYGTDVLRCGSCERMLLFSHNHDVAILKDGELAVLGLGQSQQTVRYDRATDTYHTTSANTALVDLGIAVYQTAYEQFRDRRYR